MNSRTSVTQFLVRIVIRKYCCSWLRLCVFKQGQVTYLRFLMLFTIAVPSGVISAWFWGFLMMTCQPSNEGGLMTQVLACVRASPAGWRETTTQRNMVHQPGGGWWILWPILLVGITTPLLCLLLRNTKVNWCLYISDCMQPSIYDTCVLLNLFSHANCFS